ncbi:1-deoxy-D-xylulose-5-phosphate synthase [Chengkuizengella axinellae]|uniref:1-deoxy-D-xylulose-5-phosphate synthase n=1 Tax=Chengkuizengella axinellae TaxID=3064388 RepID=A0ABT9IW70_9BACL|nr:1-deoxy-D-xylulose-5-phosphate synthase [Chengkuizengella sp. 2205SS18-9]MDP5273610.1 1-deoxy-D-xylulose-5-phosphate synthase [Chengkuizengella sp. 2205SS18-9]
MELDKINHPNDIKKFSVKELEDLAQQIREFLIQKLSVTGGHLAPNLGVVELTIVLHYLFESPKDKFIFDVGHQSYVHKILTGRKDEFDTLRQYKGLCGYIKRSESEHDVWEAGHSSTSLSAAMGMALARDLKDESNHVIALIGDGAMTGGMALEALNHIGHEKKKMIVVLNDNEMSIAPNVGAIHNHLSKIRSDKHYLKAKEEAQQILKKIPKVGGTLAKTIERLKDSMKYLMVSGILFEELGFNYIGPIDGHNIELLMEAFKQADKVDGPTLIHVVTVKGKGYSPAEIDSHKWHGVGPYKLEPDLNEKEKKGKSTPSYSNVFSSALIDLAKSDDRIVGITAAMPSGTALNKFADHFPGRMIDVGIAEQHATTMCAGLADIGMKPFFAVYSTFLQRAYDQLVHDVCRQKLNVVFAIDRAGLVGDDGETHQGVYDLAYMRHIPNIVIMVPKDENELQHMVKTAVDYNDGPIAFRYPRGAGIGVKMDDEKKSLPIGSWEVVKEGDHVAVLAVGPMVRLAEEAAKELEKENIYLEVINARFVKPLDHDMLKNLAENDKALIILEEGSMQGGLGSAILEFYSREEIFNVKVKQLGYPDYFVEHGSVKYQREEIGLTVDNIVKQVKGMYNLKNGVLNLKN